MKKLEECREWTNRKPKPPYWESVFNYWMCLLDRVEAQRECEGYVEGKGGYCIHCLDEEGRPDDCCRKESD